MRRLSYVYMVLAALCLATIGVLVKLIGNNVPVMTLNFLRIFIGFVALIIFIPFIDRTWFKVTKKDLKEFFLIGVVYAIAISLYTSANIFAPIQNAVLINYSYPFFVLLFGYFLLKEKVTRTKLITL
jgi:drug/metabolite transporter (DMT)-like permease